MADATLDVKAACNALANHREIDGSITAIFQKIRKRDYTYSYHQLTKAKAQYNFLLISSVVNGLS